MQRIASPLRAYLSAGLRNGERIERSLDWAKSAPMRRPLALAGENSGGGGGAAMTGSKMRRASSLPAPTAQEMGSPTTIAPAVGKEDQAAKQSLRPAKANALAKGNCLLLLRKD